ncbi:MAG TPA: acyl-CoA dehydrogenase family protein, partial [Actinomycetota bacterium]|nr:acyl-CoA dehydrogenase family protein [Actinomycetota bacterium]
MSDQLAIDRVHQLLAERDPSDTSPRDFLGAQFDAGLAWVHFPEGRGGLGLEPSAQRPVNEALRAAGAPEAYWQNPIGHGMGAPTVVTHGSDEQRDRYLRPLFTGEEV